MTTWADTPNRTVDVGGVTFAYRELGSGSDIPVVFLHHLTAVLDDWDPRVVDGIAAHHRRAPSSPTRREGAEPWIASPA